jgi:hypothetical protein
MAKCLKCGKISDKELLPEPGIPGAPCCWDCSRTWYDQFMTWVDTHSIKEGREHFIKWCAEGN